MAPEGRRRAVRTPVLVVVALLLVAACSSSDGNGAAGPGGSEVIGDPAEPVVEAVACEPGGVAEGGVGEGSPPPAAEGAPLTGSFDAVIPSPVRVAVRDGWFVVDERVLIVVDDPASTPAACLLRHELGRATGLGIGVVRRSGPGDGPTGPRQIRFTTSSELGPEGYRLTVEPDAITVTASGAEGSGWAVQTLLQASAPEVESPTAVDRPLAFPVGEVEDAPRFGWRGVMIDVARHFFGPDELEGVIDLMARYKLNRLHLHLSDDQGWRIAIDAYPALTGVGAATEVGGGTGGYLTKDDYRRVVDYARRRGITVVPEIDLPGHTNAALVAVPELNCDGVAPEPYTGTRVGFSSLCIGKPEVAEFVRTVLTELAEMTPGPYLHIGGDESHATDADDYDAFITETMAVVRELGKTPVGWEEVGAVPATGDRVIQHWRDLEAAEAAATAGASLVLSPSSRLYFDMAYGPFAPAGNDWAGTTDTFEVYDWDPAALVDVPPERVLGVEGPLWTELIETTEEIDQRLLPRLPALAEVAWTPQGGRDWEDFRARLALHDERWTAAGRSFTADPAIDWDR